MDAAVREIETLVAPSGWGSYGGTYHTDRVNCSLLSDRYSPCLIAAASTNFLMLSSTTRNTPEG